MMRRALILVFFLTLPFSLSAKQEDKPETVVQCEMLLADYQNLNQAAKKLHKLSVGRDFHIHFGQGSTGLFKAFGLSNLKNEDFAGLHLEVIEATPVSGKAPDADYVLRLHIPGHDTPRIISELKFNAPPIFARGREKASPQEFEEFMQLTDFDFDQMEPVSLADYGLGVRLQSLNDIPLYLNLFEDQNEVHIELGAYRPCAQSLGRGQDVELIRTSDGWFCAVPVMRFVAASELKNATPRSGATSSSKH